MDPDSLGTPNPTLRQQVYDQFKSPDAPDSIIFTIERPNRDGLLPSSEAMNRVFDQTIAFVAARLAAYYDKHGTGPKEVKLNLDLELD